MPDELTPSTNIEKFLAKTAGESVELPEPATRIEKYLNKIASEQTITEATDNWLDEHIDPTTGYVLDSTLTMNNAAPPASAVGDLKSALDEQIIISDTQPVSENNKIWINSEATSVQVPTVGDINDLIDSIFPTGTITDQVIASFNDGAKNIPVKALVVDVNSNGETGWTGCEVYNDPKYGGLINFNQLITMAGNSATNNGVTVSLNKETGLITLSGKSSGTYTNVFSNVPATEDHVYAFVIKTVTNPNNISFRVTLLNIGWSSGNMKKSGSTRSSAVGIVDFPNNTDMTGISFYASIYDLTQMFGSTVADQVLAMETSQVGDGIAWINNLLTKNYYPYNSGVQTTVSAINGEQYSHISIEFPEEAGSVEDGTIDLTNGVLTSDGDSYQLPSVEMKTFKGSNNIWSNTGNVNSLIYRKDISSLLNNGS